MKLVCLIIMDILIILQPHTYPRPSDCDNVFELQGRVESLTQWMNASLSSLNDSFPNLEMLVERLSVAVLPEIRKSLVSLLQLTVFAVHIWVTRNIYEGEYYTCIIIYCSYMSQLLLKVYYTLLSTVLHH